MAATISIVQQRKNKFKDIIFTNPVLLQPTNTSWKSLDILQKTKIDGVFRTALAQIREKLTPCVKLSFTSQDIQHMPITSMLEQVHSMKTLIVEFNSAQLLHMITYNQTSIQNKYPSHQTLISAIAELLIQRKSATYMLSTSLDKVQLTSPVLIMDEMLTNYEQLLQSASTKVQAFIQAVSANPNVPNLDITTIIESLRHIYVTTNTLGIPNDQIKIHMSTAITDMFIRANINVLGQYNIYQHDKTNRVLDPYQHLIEVAADITKNPPAGTMILQPTPTTNFPIMDPHDPMSIIAANNFIASQRFLQSNSKNTSNNFQRSNNQHNSGYKGIKVTGNQHNQRKQANNPYQDNDTRPCFNFQQGKCKFGSTCRFSHDSAGAGNRNDQHHGNKGNKPKQNNNNNAKKRVTFSKGVNNKYHNYLHSSYLANTAISYDDDIDIDVYANLATQLATSRKGIFDTGCNRTVTPLAD